MAIAFSILRRVMVRYFARLSRLMAGIWSMTSRLAQQVHQLVDGVGEAALRVEERVVRRLDRGHLAGDRLGTALGRDLWMVDRLAAGHGTQLGEGQLAGGDLLGQPTTCALVTDLHQLVGMRDGVPAQRHQLTNLGRRLCQADAVLDVALVLADLLGELADAVAEIQHLAEHRRLLERGDVLALEVLDDADLERGLLIELDDDGRDRRHAPPCATPASGARRRSARTGCRPAGRGSAAGRRARGCWSASSVSESSS